ncbi:hypothetical protein KUL152_09330 [Tenacibaculum sp. KUL152]|nr:hypothetical protein KUL152_09330 [Tenacibaculum sp. KUL152]
MEDEPNNWLDTFERQGPIYHVVSEFIDVAPGLVTIWFLINIPLLLNVTYKYPSNKSDPPDHKNQQRMELGEEKEKRQKLKKEFFDRLPQALGRDIVSITSELHYVNVKTTEGRTLIIGGLKQIADALDDEGVLIHRSHWVHKNHVIRVHISSNKAWCEMSNGENLPISRSKRKLVKSFFGNKHSSVRTKGNTKLSKIK